MTKTIHRKRSERKQNMNITNSEYKRYAEKHAPPSPVAMNMVKAFLVGGGICAVGQGFLFLYTALGLEKTVASTLVSITLVLFSVILTGLDLYDGMAKFGGAGTLVPITGFANAVVSPAIDNKAEGYVLGLGAKIFTISGPVILYGVFSSVLYGIFIVVKTMIMGGNI